MNRREYISPSLCSYVRHIVGDKNIRSLKLMLFPKLYMTSLQVLILRIKSIISNLSLIQSHTKSKDPLKRLYQTTIS